MYHIQKSKGIKDLSVVLETIKLTEKNVGKSLLDIGLGDDLFLGLIPKAKKTKVKINKWTASKLKYSAQIK